MSESGSIPDPIYDLPDGIIDFEGVKTSGENILTQIDPYCQQLLENSIWDFYNQNDGSGKIVRLKGSWEKRYKYNPDGSVEQLPSVFIEGKCKYPDLLNAYAWAASHLNMNLNLQTHQAYYLIEDWEGLFKEPLELKYDDFPQIITLLDAIGSIFERNMIESIHGSGQKYNMVMAGGHRIQEILNRKPQ